MQSIFGACTNAASAFDTVGHCLTVTDVELHRTDLFAFFAADAMFLFDLQLVFLASEQVLGRAHRTEGTPGPWAQEGTEDDCNCCGHNAHGHEDHAYFFKHVQGPYDAHDPVAHEAHKQEKDRDPQPETPEHFGDLLISGYFRYPEVYQASPGTEVSAEPAASEGAYQEDGGKDQQHEVPEGRVPEPSDGHYEDKNPQVRRYFEQVYQPLFSHCSSSCPSLSAQVWTTFIIMFLILVLE